MALSYLKHRYWTHWTREERFFCAALYSNARTNPAELAAWVIKHAELSLAPGGEWDLGFEVCFYRDYLWPTQQTARQLSYPAKRTFDLCLFGESAMIIVEAKVFERFSAKQNREFDKDARLISQLPGLEAVQVCTVALASSRYFSNAAKFAKSDSLEVFDGLIKWSELAEFYQNDKLLNRADSLYKIKKAHLLLEQGGI